MLQLTGLKPIQSLLYFPWLLIMAEPSNNLSFKSWCHSAGFSVLWALPYTAPFEGCLEQVQTPLEQCLKPHSTHLNLLHVLSLHSIQR